MQTGPVPPEQAAVFPIEIPFVDATATDAEDPTATDVLAVAAALGPTATWLDCGAGADALAPMTTAKLPDAVTPFPMPIVEPPGEFTAALVPMTI